MTYEICPTHLAVQAMRDNGYKNAAYAIAELIDNAIQAESTSIGILCGEKLQQSGTKSSRYVDKIAVLDNGKGMDADTLRIALQFGNGKYLDPSLHTGIGRYGMGLPSSSISQCQRVDVWTWTNDSRNAIHSFLDLDAIKNEKLTSVPEPKNKKIPDIWQKVGGQFSKSGTLVVWSKIDKCIWRTATAIIRNSELLVGRIYRKFIDQNDVVIKMKSFNIDSGENLQEKIALPNDPIYLMRNTSCPAPFNKSAMFDLYGEHAYPIKYRGTIHEVIIRFTIAKEEARLGYNAGDKLHGKHAAKNLGVSIIRAGRELDIDLSIVNSYDTRERWWGIEVAFPPALDEIFGVTNNKQAARYFSDVLKLDFEDFCKREDASPTEVLQNMREDGDPHAHLIEIVRHMKDNLKTMRSLIKMQVKGNQAQMRNIGNEAENLATEATRERQEKGYIGQSDEGEKRPVEERKEEIEKTLKDMGTSQETVNSLIRATFNPVGTLKYIFNHADVETQAFFIVKLKAGEIIISLNTNHPAYDKLFEILEEETDIDDVKTLQTHLKKAREALKLLFMAWARYEDEQPDGEKKSIAQQVRYDWGIIARQFLSGE